MPRRIRPAPSSAAQRSAISNSPHRLPNVDMRSAAGRRFRDLVDGVIREFGDASPEAVRELATLKLTLEAVQTQFLQGDGRLGRDVVPLLRSIERKEQALRAAKAREHAKATITPLVRHFSRGIE